jgi:hypothetical protein
VLKKNMKLMDVRTTLSTTRSVPVLLLSELCGATTSDDAEVVAVPSTRGGDVLVLAV